MLVNKQNEIMDYHEDYAPMRSDKTVGLMGGKEQIAKGVKGISKILTDETIQYPSWGALSEFSLSSLAHLAPRLPFRIHQSSYLLYASIPSPLSFPSVLSKFFIPVEVFRDTDVVEYQLGKKSFVSASKRFINKQTSLIAFQKGLTRSSSSSPLSSSSDFVEGMNNQSVREKGQEQERVKGKDKGDELPTQAVQEGELEQRFKKRREKSKGSTPPLVPASPLHSLLAELPMLDKSLFVHRKT